jgi:small GTP-binding protein
VYKVLFAGLDYAGKTSILHVLRKQYSFLNKLKPTKGIDRTQSKILEIDFTLWDLGGQEQYISEYFNRKEQIFTDLDLLFFVVDLQDEIRFEKVLSYFERIIAVFREQDQSPNIVVIFHKVDSDIEYSNNIKLFSKDLSKKMKNKATGFNIAFFQTSIFKRWSIIAAFSYGIRSLSEKKYEHKLIDYLESWSDYYGANATLLMNSDEIIISDYSSDEASANTLNQYLDELLNIYSVSKKPVVVRMDGDLLALSPLQIGKKSLLLIKYTNNPQITEAQFTTEVPIKDPVELDDLLTNFFQKV